MGAKACKCKCLVGAREAQDNGEPLIDQPDADMVARYFGLKPTCWDEAASAMQMRMAFGSTRGMDPNRAIPLVAWPSPHLAGMQVYMPAEDSGLLSGSVPSTAGTLPNLKGKPVIVGTVRMGFGHHRIAYSAVTWALELGANPFLIDILGIDCPETQRVAAMDHMYSKASRISSNIGGIVDEIWSKMMLSGGVNALRFSCLLAEQLKPLMQALPKDVPLIAAHPWIGQIAVACGIKTVINLVIDNHPQYFVLVPGAYNLVQAPSYYSKLLTMGIPAATLQYAGHWVSRDIALNARADCEARIKRCQKKQPTRLLVAIGGAGAQQKYVQGFILGMRPLLESGRVKLFINSGDHGFMADNLRALFDREGLQHVLHRSQAALESFLAEHELSRLDDPSTDPMITIFNFETHYEAFRATDYLIRVADVLATKPSELAFFPIPKLHLRHVGGHESFSATRSCELGDGTVECTTVPMALQHLELFAQGESPLLLQMCRSIIENDGAKVYNGSKVAMELALSVR
mmetsp:Transcript_11778/g.31109  ORF Transcript_11778/g.31109 Transcript_11778/m.31109 type:complete len:517 (-) Transcript_11778:98-1648(-)